MSYYVKIALLVWCGSGLLGLAIRIPYLVRSFDDPQADLHRELQGLRRAFTDRGIELSRRMWALAVALGIVTLLINVLLLGPIYLWRKVAGMAHGAPPKGTPSK